MAKADAVARPPREASASPHEESAPQSRSAEMPPAEDEQHVTSSEFTILGSTDLAGLCDELKATDDIANARRAGPMRYDAQERIVKLLRRGRPLVSGGIAYPGNSSFSNTCLWIFEVLLLLSLIHI